MMSLLPRIATYLKEREAEFSMIGDERRALLQSVSDYIKSRLDLQQTVRLNFICTHNSRRSHMGQLWAAASANYFDFDILTYSGGTEATAFNPRAVAALERAGFQVSKTTDDENPIYHVRMSDTAPAMTCFSKKYNSAPNPKGGYAAIMVCSSADQGCPFLTGAGGRFAIPFVDPKISDGSNDESEVYDERCTQIAREILYMMSQL